jgi:hypothetical protein
VCERERERERDSLGERKGEEERKRESERVKQKRCRRIEDKDGGEEGIQKQALAR